MSTMILTPIQFGKFLEMLTNKLTLRYIGNFLIVQSTSVLQYELLLVFLSRSTLEYKVFFWALRKSFFFLCYVKYCSTPLLEGLWLMESWKHLEVHLVALRLNLPKQFHPKMIGLEYNSLHSQVNKSFFFTCNLYFFYRTSFLWC